MLVDVFLGYQVVCRAIEILTSLGNQINEVFFFGEAEHFNLQLHSEYEYIRSLRASRFLDCRE